MLVVGLISVIRNGFVEKLKFWPQNPIWVLRWIFIVFQTIRCIENILHQKI
jgi:hypothetical protein